MHRPAANAKGDQHNDTIGERQTILRAALIVGEGTTDETSQQKDDVLQQTAVASESVLTNMLQ